MSWTLGWLVGWSLGLWLPWVAAAQTSDGAKAGARPQSGKTSDVEFDRSARQETPPGNAAVIDDPGAWIAQALPDMVQWPAERGENAIRALLSRGPEELKDPLRRLLRKGSVRERAAAARALALLKDQESYGPVEELLYDRRFSDLYSSLLETLGLVDEGRTLDLCLRLIAARSGSLRRSSATYLRPRMKPALVDRLAAIYRDSDIAAVRLEVFSSLRISGALVLDELAMEGLGDLDAELSWAIVDHLGWRKSDDLKQRLVELARTRQDRTSFRSWLVLAALERHFGDVALPDELFDFWVQSSRSSDRQMGVSAAVAAATVGLRRDDLSEITRDKVVPALMEFVINARYFPDFNLCVEHAIAVLQQITGQKFGRNVPLWHEYWKSHGNGDFRMVADLSGFLIDQDAVDAVIQWEQCSQGGEMRSRRVLLGENHRARLFGPESADSLMLPRAAMGRLLLQWVEAGLFSTKLPRELVSVKPGAQRLVVRSRGRERIVATDADSAEFERLVAALEDAIADLRWQVMLARNEGFPRRFVEEEAWWATHGDPAERHRRLLDLSTVELSTADAARTERIFEVLDGIDHAERLLTDAHRRRLSEMLSSWPLEEARTRQLFEWMLKASETTMLKLALNALAPRAPVSLPWMSEALLRMDGAQEALADSREAVQLAAVEALASAKAVPVSELSALVKGTSSDAVRGKALDLLARSQDASAGSILFELLSSQDVDTRARALRSLGFFGGEQALDALAAGLKETDLRIVQGAVDGLMRRGDSEAARLLEARLLEDGLKSTGGRLCLLGIKALPRAVATQSLLLLAATQRPELFAEAQYGLANLGDMRSVPFLIEQLKEPATHPRARSLLTYLFCRDYLQEPWRYAAVHETTPDLDHADHFLQALLESGRVAPSSLDPNAPETMSLLADCIEDERWYIRRSALEFLEESSGRSLGSLSVSATKGEIETMARRWRELITALARR